MSNPNTRYAQFRDGAVVGQYARAEQASADAAAVPGNWALAQFDIDAVTNAVVDGSIEMLGQFNGPLPIRYILWNGNGPNSQITQYTTQQIALAVLAAAGVDAASYSFARVVIDSTTGAIIDGVLLDPNNGTDLGAAGPALAQAVPVVIDLTGGNDDQNPDQNPDQTPDDNPDQMPDDSPDQAPDDNPDQTPDGNAYPTPDPTPGTGLGRPAVDDRPVQLGLGSEARLEVSTDTDSQASQVDQNPGSLSTPGTQRGNRRIRRQRDGQQQDGNVDDQVATLQATIADLRQQIGDANRNRVRESFRRPGQGNRGRGGRPPAGARGKTVARGGGRHVVGERGRWTPAPMAGPRMARQLREDRATANNGVGRRRRRTEVELLMLDAIRFGYTQIPNMSVVTGEPLTGELEQFEPSEEPDEIRDFVRQFTSEIWQRKMDRSRAIDAAAAAAAADPDADELA